MVSYAKLWRAIGVAIDRINDWFFALAAVIVAFMMVSICYDVVMRSLGKPTIWVQELSSLGMLWVTFLALAASSRKGVHVSIDYLVMKFKDSTRAIFYIGHSVVITAIAGVFFCFGTVATWNAYVKGLHELSMLELPIWPTIIIIPIGSLFMFLEYIKRTRTLIIKVKEGESIDKNKRRWKD